MFTGTSAARITRLTPAERSAADTSMERRRACGCGLRSTFEMQQALEGMVVEIARAAGDVAQHVLALARLADLVEAVVTLVLEVLFPKFEHGPAPRLAARRAWTRHPGWR